MKSFFRLFLAFFSLVIVLSSCSTSNDVVSNHLIQKRKYQRGFHFDFASKHPKTAVKYAETDVEREEDELKEQVKAEKEAELIDFSMVEAEAKAPELKQPKQFTKAAIKAMAPVSMKKHFAELKEIMPSKPKDGIEPDNESSSSETAGVSLVLALLSWALAIISMIISFTGIPIVPSILLLFALISSIVAVSLASKDRKTNQLAHAAFILGWIYLSLAILAALVITLIIVLIILVLTSIG